MELFSDSRGIPKGQTEWAGFRYSHPTPTPPTGEANVANFISRLFKRNIKLHAISERTVRLLQDCTPGARDSGHRRMRIDVANVRASRRLCQIYSIIGGSCGPCEDAWRATD